MTPAKYQTCSLCHRDMKIRLPSEPDNPAYVCVDCVHEPSPLNDKLHDTEFMWRAKYTSLGLTVAKRTFQSGLRDENGVPIILCHARAVALLIRDKPDRQTEFKYTFFLNLTTGKWERNGLAIRKQKLYQKWFSFETLKAYGLEAVIQK